MAIIKTRKTKMRGASLIELILAMAIISTTLVSILSITNLSLKIAAEKRTFYQALALAQETIEGIRNFRDGTIWNGNGLGTLMSSFLYHLEKNGNPSAWAISSGEKTSGIFTQKIIFHDVYRDFNDNITEGGGILDQNSKKAEAAISWPGKDNPQEIKLYYLFTNWK